VTFEIAEAQSPLFQVRFEGAFGNVPGDEGLLRKALLNLVRNAAEACATATAGGQVLLKGEWFRAEDGGSQRIQILDNGSGIENDALGKLVSSLLHHQGGRTGLGWLWCRKSYVPAWRASRSAQSSPKGSVFIVTLRCARACRKR